MAVAETQSQEIVIAVLKTAERFRDEFSSVLKVHEITEPQFNVLRILRGSQQQPLSCQQIGERMITRVPDITRLLDRLERRRLVRRERSDFDRRVVQTRITEEGLSLLSALDRPMREYHRTRFLHMTRQELAQLAGLLAKAYQPG
ncbi:MAG: MarR family transcriptional regulator [candidate division Zixibacteria bacterium]|jgi:DNA-binding MarR family transcriptional regulator|nr:MarR family transcriptional regulator [candidate division Zixibacteria bacterium]